MYKRAIQISFLWTLKQSWWEGYDRSNFAQCQSYVNSNRGRHLYGQGVALPSQDKYIQEITKQRVYLPSETSQA